MPVNWLPKLDLKSLGIPSNLPPISFAPPPGPAPATTTQPSPAPAAKTTATQTATPTTSTSSILSPYGPVDPNAATAGVAPATSTLPPPVKPAAKVSANSTVQELQPTTIAMPVATPTPATQAQTDAAAAAGIGKSAAASSTAAGVAGQQQQSAQAGAAATASAIGAALDPNDPNVIRDPQTGQLRRLTDAEISDRARAQSRSATASSTAAGIAGKQNEVAGATAAANASNTAAKTASVQPATSTPASAPTPNGTSTVTPPAAPTLPSAFNTALTKNMETLSKWAEGMPDQQYKNALNQIITSSALMDQAEKDALQMQINQDPALRGQGAGLAMMQVMARDHGFNLDMALAKASGESLDRIISMQKYGIEGSNAMIEAARNNALEDARIALENAQQARNNSIEDAKIARTNAQEDIRTLSDAGQFDAAAAAMNKYFTSAYPGLGLTVDAASLRSRDPQELTKMTQKLNFIKDLAGKNRAAALPIITSLMADPAFKDYFPAGLTAEQVADTLASGSIAENITQANAINTQINEIASVGVDGKSQSFDETGDLYEEYFKLSGRDAVNEGRKLATSTDGLKTINEMRAAEGMPPLSTDAQGNLVDELGVLDDADYKELAYRKDFYDKQQAAQTKPWEQKRNAILDSPLGKYFTDEKLYPGANDSLNKFLMAYSLSADAFITDPQTGEVVPNWDKLNLSLNSPEMWPIFHNWPVASFAPDGTVAKDAQGNLLTTAGGYVYGETGPDGKPVLSTPADQAMDDAYFAYRNGGGTLKPNEWYYATQGGALPPNEKNIPASVKPPVEDFTKVGDPSNPQPTDPVVASKSVEDKIAKGEPLTKEDITLAKTEGLVTAMTSSGGGSGEILGGGAATYLQSHPDGNILMDGQLVKLLRGYTAGSMSLAEIEYHGNKYYLDNKGRWYAEPVVQNSRSMPPTIPNPLTESQDTSWSNGTATIGWG